MIDPFKREPDYFDHVGHGCSMVGDALGAVFNVMMQLCFIMFGWPLYLLSKLATREE
jgi:hypothetical protein